MLRYRIRVIMRFLAFWWANLSWSLDVVFRGDQLLQRLILGLVAAAGVVGVGLSATIREPTLLLLGAPFVFLAVVVAPYRAFKAISTELELLTTPRLVVGEAEPYTLNSNPTPSSPTQTWLRLEVINPTGMAIQRVYGNIIEFVSVVHSEEGGYATLRELGKDSQGLTMMDDPLPPQGHGLPWSPEGGNPPMVIELPGHDSARYLYVVMTRQRHDIRFHTCSAQGPSFPTVGAGAYRVRIEVGSLIEAFPPIRVAMIFEKTFDIRQVSFEVEVDE